MAMRLPKEYRFESDEVHIRRDEATGDLVLSQRPDTWDGFFALDTKDVPAGFMTGEDRNQGQHNRRPPASQLWRTDDKTASRTPRDRGIRKHAS
jgi:antitoxin VapB